MTLPRKVFSALLLHSQILLWWGCAAVAPPGGGPEDNTPPELISVIPENGTLHFTGGTVRLEFSEYIAEQSISAALRVAPRLATKLPIIYKGKILEFEFPESLEVDQTYVLTLSRDLKDEHNVPLAEPIQIAFSTGGAIDQGSINGRVYGTGAYTIHLWKSTGDDSLFASLPLYLSDTDDDGYFRFKYLPTGDFSLIAVERQSAGLALNPERTNYGVPSQRKYFLNKNGVVENINIRPWREPPPLRLERGEWVGHRWGWLYFSRPLEENEQMDSLFLTLADGRILEPRSFVDYKNRNKYLILSPDSLPPGKMTVTVGDIYSVDSLVLKRTTLGIRVPAEPDTSYLELLHPDTSITLSPDKNSGPPLSLTFSTPVVLADELTFPLVAGDSDTVALKLEWKSPVWVEIQPETGWQPKKDYRLTLAAEKINPLAGRSFKDSVVTITIHSGRKIGYGGLEGTIADSSRESLMTLLTPVKKAPQGFTAFVNSSLQFQYNEIPEGFYQLMLFEDRDLDGDYSFGKAYPFQPSEWFYVVPDTISIRANWDVELGPIQIEEQTF